MKIAFKQIGRNDHHVEYAHHDDDDSVIKMDGTLCRQDAHLIKLTSRLKGTLTLTCDSCATAFDYPVDESFDCLISDRPYSHADDSLPELDVIECEKGIIDLEEIVAGETASIRMDYHKCKTCLENEKES